MATFLPGLGSNRDRSSGVGSDSVWRERPWFLAALLGAAGFAVYLLTRDAAQIDGAEGRLALAALVGATALTFAFTWDRDHWREPLVFSALTGSVVGGIVWRALHGGDTIAAPFYGVAAGIFAAALALPLFQARFHRQGVTTPYAAVHGAVWCDAIGVAASLAFVGVAWLTLHLLSALFELLKLDLLSDLIAEDWFQWTFSGAAMGAALGVLRNEGPIIGTLHRIAVAILGMLAVLLAAGLAVFLGAMAVSGPDVLWAATRNSTHILLACAAAAWVLAHVLLGDEDSGMSGNRALHVSAFVLALAVLPLSMFAAVSMGVRIAQHGLTPERLWGLVAVALAVAHGVAWLVAVIRGWRGGAWRERTRRASLHMMVLSCWIALLLAMPILDFGAISARQQVARLVRGDISADKFDFSSLRWEFGAAGHRALQTLAKNPNFDIARAAAAALREKRIASSKPAQLDRSLLTVQTSDPAMRARAMAYLTRDTWDCAQGCQAIDIGPAAGGQRFAIVSRQQVYTVVLNPTGELVVETRPPVEVRSVLYRHGDRVELRGVTRTMVTVNGTPVGEPIDRLPTRVDAPPSAR